MSTNYFTPEQVKLLEANKYVKNVSQKGITYSEDFKRDFITLKELGHGTARIFRNCGLEPEILGQSRVYGFARRMKVVANRNEGTATCERLAQDGHVNQSDLRRMN